MTLVSDTLSVTLRVGGLHEGRELTYRASRSGQEQDPRYASIHALLDPQRFATRLRKELAKQCSDTRSTAVLLTA